MFLIVDEQHVFASAGYLATQGLKDLVSNVRIIGALLERYNFYFPFLLSNVGPKLYKLMDKSPAVQFPVSTSN